MIETISVLYSVSNIDVNLSIPTDSENLSYNLASLFARIILDTKANPSLVIEQLTNDLETE